MIAKAFIRFALWLVDETDSSERGHALAGDLLEELEGGRSMRWFFYQVAAAIWFRSHKAIRRWVELFAFSAGWSVLYPAWRTLCVGGLNSTFDHSSFSLAWPWSSLVPLIDGVFPATVFVFFGLLAYSVLSGSIRSTSANELMHGLSTGSAMLSVICLVVLRQLARPQLVITDVARSDFFMLDHFYWVSLPLTVSLWFTLQLSVSDTFHIGRRRRVRLATWRLKFSRIAPLLGIVLVPCVTSSARSQSLPTMVSTTNARPSIKFVQVTDGVNLEVIDWGGTGRPLVFLAGLGNDAHVYDSFAPRFTTTNHVYAITRKGFGASSKPSPANGNYTADRLGDDVLSVLDQLKLKQPVLVGHSLAGEELSSIGSRYPERIRGLIYLDAGYGYAIYDTTHGDSIFDFLALEKKMENFMDGAAGDEPQFFKELSVAIDRMSRDLKEGQNRNVPAAGLHPPRRPIPPIIKAINLGGQEYTSVNVPVLAIFACPHNMDFDSSLAADPKAKAAAIENDLFYTSRQIDAFHAAIPAANVVKLPDASHYVFRSNALEVGRAMDAFLVKLQ